ncbi:MAG: hypothetical protein HZC42_11670 [Candidatus Eisenbacteria bacterium]|nr:hypothetical protein [Candidatus Eisenbacteria bacterium]
MSDADPREELLWESGWEGHSRAQRRRLARLPLAEKLLWLEEAHRVILRLQGNRPRADDGTSSTGPAE